MLERTPVTESLFWRPRCVHELLLEKSGANLGVHAAPLVDSDWGSSAKARLAAVLMSFPEIGIFPDSRSRVRLLPGNALIVDSAIGAASGSQTASEEKSEYKGNLGASEQKAKTRKGLLSTTSLESTLVLDTLYSL
jgi:hypothetical protein